MKPRNRRRGPQGAEDFLNELARDSEYQAKKATLDAKRQAEAQVLASAELPVVEALRGAGFMVSSVWDLVNTTERYTAALPLLLDHLQRPYPDKVREGIARAMAVPESKFAWQTLVSLFRREFDPRPNGVKWAIGCALAAAADDDVIQDLIALLSEKRHGENRVAFMIALKRSRLANARVALEAGRSDPDLTREISRLLDRPGRPGKRRNAPTGE
jgi:hypothetical protein